MRRHRRQDEASSDRSLKAPLLRFWIIVSIYALNAFFAVNPLSIVLTAPVLVLVLIGLMRIGSPFMQVGDMLWFCIFVFFVLSPLQRIGYGTIGGAGGITSYAYSPHDFAMASTAIFLFLLPFTLLKLDGTRSSFGSDRPQPNFFLLIVANITAFLAFAAAQGGLDQVLAPRLAQENAFIANMLFLALQSITVAMIAARWRMSGGSAAFCALVLVATLLLVTRNPFNASRFSLLATWLPLGLALCGGRIRAATFYIGSFAGMIILFPILNITTRFGVAGLTRLTDLSFDRHFLSIPYVDVFDTAVHTIRYMSGMELMAGQKLLAIVLFFVPRVFWPEKPVVGGLDIGYSLYNAGMAGTPNLSLFIGMDFYMDFGIWGVVLGGAICATLLRTIQRAGFGTFHGQPILNYVLIASLPILLRGPVGAILPLFACQVFVLWAWSRMIWRPHQTSVLFSEQFERPRLAFWQSTALRPGVPIVRLALANRNRLIATSP